MEPASFRAQARPLAELDDFEANPFLAPYHAPIRRWLRADGRVPKRRDLGFRDFGGWHDSMIVSEILEDGDLKFRLVGQRAADIFDGLIRAGGRFSAVPGIVFSDFHGHFGAIRAGGVYGRVEGIVPFEGREHAALHVLDLPVKDSEGCITFLYSFFRQRPTVRAFSE